ncbi:MAG: DUF4129 domain-containing protein [Anaerolineales bacterium]|nr:DUF4129 domain-containing protein [Anaerolineales bacterium]
MRTFFQRKLWTVILSAVALTALSILAIGLKDFAFRPVLQFQQKEEDQVWLPAEITEIVDQITAISFQKHLIMWGVMLLLVILVGLFLSPELRKRLLLMFLRIALFALVLIYLLQNDKLPFLSESLQITPPAGNSLGPGNTGLPAPPVFQPPQISPFLAYILSLGVVLLLIGLVMIVNRWWTKLQQFQDDELALDDIARIARSSLDDISGGQDWENVIVNCYVRMSQVASAKRGLHRHASMTPGEFASRLENAGLPADAIQRLTRLFESVRYGAIQSTQKENDEAVNCLTAILRYCGETA